MFPSLPENLSMSSSPVTGSSQSLWDSYLNGVNGSTCTRGDAARYTATDTGHGSGHGDLSDYLPTGDNASFWPAAGSF